MHTLIATVVGLLLLGLFMFFGPAQRPATYFVFIGAWLLLCIVHLVYGVRVAGYGLGEELAVHAVVFGLPAVLALVLALRLR